MTKGISSLESTTSSTHETYAIERNFVAFDANNDGLIKPWEAKEALKSLHIKAPDKLIHSLFTGKNALQPFVYEQVNINNWEHLYNDTNTLNEDIFDNLFISYQDTNTGGFIHTNELQTLLNGLYPDIAPETLQALSRMICEVGNDFCFDGTTWQNGISQEHLRMFLEGTLFDSRINNTLPTYTLTIEVPHDTNTTFDALNNPATQVELHPYLVSAEMDDNNLDAERLQIRYQDDLRMGGIHIPTLPYTATRTIDLQSPPTELRSHYEGGTTVMGITTTFKHDYLVTETENGRSLVQDAFWIEVDKPAYVKSAKKAAFYAHSTTLQNLRNTPFATLQKLLQE